MKKRISSIIFMFSLVFLSCITDVKDCICPTEFRGYNITIIDTSGNPVDSLVTRITNSRGREFTPYGSYYQHSLEGKYWIMDDLYKNEFTIRPTSIFFEAAKESVTVEAAFLFNTDECKCHVNKIAGPDIIVAQ
jgi:hypothetical protein